MPIEKQGYIFYDGAMGTMLLERGLKPGERPDIMNMTAPQVVADVHKMYIEAGSDIICANTFGANAIALEGTGYTPEQVITAAVGIAKSCSSSAPSCKDSILSCCDSDMSCGKDAACSYAPEILVALDIGPIGQMLEPVGDLEYDRAYELFAEQAIAGERAGADCAAIETMSDLTELKAAVLAVKENTGLPVLATMTFDQSGHTFMGCTPEDFVETAAQLGVDAVGINCSLEPSQMYETVRRIAAKTSLPVIVKPNAGLPDQSTGKYSISPQEFAQQMAPFKEMGVRIIGGCCGTTPEYIRELRKVFC